jgi:hypothetical protein
VADKPASRARARWESPIAARWSAIRATSSTAQPALAGLAIECFQEAQREPSTSSPGLVVFARRLGLPLHKLEADEVSDPTKDPLRTSASERRGGLSAAARAVIAAEERIG